jgi:hypothetical protein
MSEEKPGCHPGYFEIPACLDGKPQTLMVGPSIHHLYIDDERGSITVTIPANRVAASIVNDYISAQLVSSEAARPGVFWVSGEFKMTNPTHMALLEEARVKQKNWFVELVKLADDDWSRYKSHRMISDIQRYACSALDLEREWRFKPAPAESKCPACKSSVEPDTIVCPSCRCVLDVEGYKKLQFATK